MSFNITIDLVKAAQKRNEQVEASRKAAYLSEADPLFFKAQRGEIPITAWQQKVAEIKSRFPKE